MDDLFSFADRYHALKIVIMALFAIGTVVTVSFAV
jgi:hypothetical protein